MSNVFLRRALEESGALQTPEGEVTVKGPIGLAFSDALAKAFPMKPEENIGVATESFRCKIKKCATESESDQGALMRIASGINSAIVNSGVTGDTVVYMTSPETINDETIKEISGDLINTEPDKAGNYIVVVDATDVEQVNSVENNSAGLKPEIELKRIETALEAITTSLGGKFVRVV